MIYLVCFYQWYETEVCGAFASREAAQAYINANKHRIWFPDSEGFDITEMPVQI